MKGQPVIEALVTICWLPKKGAQDQENTPEPEYVDPKEMATEDHKKILDWFEKYLEDITVGKWTLVIQIDAIIEGKTLQE